MATVSIEGHNASYKISLSDMDTQTRYHVFVYDLDTDGILNGAYCRRSSLGSSSTWTYSGTSSSTYEVYQRLVQVYTTTQSTSWSVGTKYTSSEINASGTSSKWKGSKTSIFSDYIPRAYTYQCVFQLYLDGSWNQATGVMALKSSSSSSVEVPLSTAKSYFSIDSSWTFSSAEAVQNCTYRSSTFIMTSKSASSYSLGRLYYINPVVTYSCSASGETGISTATVVPTTVNSGGSAKWSASANSSGGYRFLYWKSGSSTDTSNPMTITNITSNQSWTAYAIKTYSCTASAGTGISEATVSSSTVDTGGSCTWNCTIQSGYLFSHWYNGSTYKYSQSFYIDNITSDQSWTAWGVIGRTCTAVAGSGIASATVSSGFVPNGTACTWTASPSTNYKFDHWTNGTTDVYQNPMTISEVYSNQTWTAIGAPTALSCSAIKDTGIASATVSDASIQPGGSCTWDCEPSSGYRFLSWTNGTSIKTTKRFQLTNIQSDQHWTAHAKKVYSCTASTSTGISSASVSPATVDTGESAVWTAVADTDYDFYYWQKGTSKDYNNPMTVSNIQSDQSWTAYAKAKPSYSYNQQYAKNAGSDTVTNMPSNQHEDSTAESKVFHIPANVPLRTGYTFQGWNTESDGSGDTYAVDSDGPTISKDSSSITLWAIWRKNSYEITVTHHPSCPSPTGLTLSGGGNFEYKTTITISAVVASNRSFDGWYTHNGTSYVKYTSNKSFSWTVDSIKTFYALTTKIQPTKPIPTFNGSVTSSSISVSVTIQQLTYSDEWYLLYSTDSTFATYNYVTGSGTSATVELTGLPHRTTYYFKVRNKYDGNTVDQDGYQDYTTKYNNFVWDNNDNLDNRQPTANEWNRLVDFVETTCSVTVSQAAKDSIAIGKSLTAALFNEIASDVSYAMVVSRGQQILKSVLRALSDQANTHT